MQNITAPEEGGSSMHCPAPVRRQSPVTLSHSHIDYSIEYNVYDVTPDLSIDFVSFTTDESEGEA